LLSDFSSKGDGTAAALTERFSSIFAGSKLYKSESLEGRRVESKFAIPKIAQHPLLGIGLGNAYRPQIFPGDNDYLTKYIHNGYLWMLLYIGLVGLLPFLWFCIRFISRGYLHWNKIKDAEMGGMLSGFTLSVLGALIINIVDPLFRSWFSAVVFSIGIGLGEVIIRINQPEVKKIR
jgi:O-antigen ligase